MQPPDPSELTSPIAFEGVPRPADDDGREERENLDVLQLALRRQWDLGRNVLLLWRPTEQGVDLLCVPHYSIGGFVASRRIVPAPYARRVGDRALGGVSSGRFLAEMVKGSRCVTHDFMQFAARLLETTPVLIPVPHPGALTGAVLTAIDDLVLRHSIGYVEDRAVFLIDISRFSLFEPVAQMTQLNSLAYSLNSAQARLARTRMHVDFARSSTGDGFYVWNRDAGADANLNLYHLMQFTLADNGLAHARSTAAGTVPTLKSAFHIGGGYEFRQYEALQPTEYSYVVGDVTIELARIVEQAQPGQILVGDFRTRVPDQHGREFPGREVDARGFIARLQDSLADLRGLRLAGGEIDSIRCYLTGPRERADRWGVTRLQAIDKHGLSRDVFNAKMNIHRIQSPPIFLGLQDDELVDTDRVRRVSS
ncbi:MAG: hypothetical protein AB7Q97_01000 [Gammaproteobacteria bacterium]